MFIDDQKAVMGLPFFYTVALIVAAVILGILSYSLISIQHESQIHQIEYQIEQIIAEAKNMYEYADDGSFIHKKVDFPSSMKTLVFGALPKQDEPVSSSTLLDENTSNNYFYVTDDGRIFPFHSSVRFSGENTTQIAVLVSGSYEITMELQSKDGTTYVTIYRQ
jgi:hypothetical protein